ncbi:MAG: hypothetical protein LBC12_04580 [Nitrososphaerota archaeon]|nr:hypothetical protein [Nitrososphaerota archaeon]
MTTNKPIHNYQQSLNRTQRTLKTMQNGKLALQFLDHLGALGLSLARVTKYVTHLPPLLRMINTDLKTMTKTDVEAIVAAINGCDQKEWIKHDKKLALRKLLQYAKAGSCAKGTPYLMKLAG